ncbi:GFA family protein [Kaustia mangrovi]|uniref:GFA family protein n=1 Tax=Kaustia mangrovi TaxID=2593653 RepID=A0A7S8HDG9_9HYPH|nr:GFA family protein [Kaustia mangrovi]QPC44802.1 GFA family protein [Kaustia mangrovi]
MDGNAKSVPGRCLCGAVTFTAMAGDRDVGVCHCSMCRHWTAGVFMALHCEGVTLDKGDELGVYRSSDWGERCFCKACGTPLFWRMHDGSMYAVSVNALDVGEDLKLASEIFIDEKPGYYAFANDTHRMTGAEVIAMVTGGQEE